MATGWGVERANDKGFDTASARQINAAEYSVGVLRGCKISTSSTNRTYKVSRGSDPASIAVGSATAADGAVIFPVPDGLTTGAVAAGDPTNPRIDSIYAVQHDAAAGDADNQVVLVAVSGTPAATPVPPAAPAGIAVRLASFTVPKSASTTSQATPFGDTPYSIPYGGSAGVLFMKQDMNTGSYGTTPADWITGSIYVPTDRLVEISIDTCMRLGSGSSAQLGYAPKLDGVQLAWYDGPLLGPNAYASAHFSLFTTVTAGRHTVALNYGRENGDGVPYGVYAAKGRQGTSLRVIDHGVSQ